MTNERKVELLRILRKRVILTMCKSIDNNLTFEEESFINFEINRFIAELNYSINYYEVHKKWH